MSTSNSAWSSASSAPQRLRRGRRLILDNSSAAATCRRRPDQIDAPIDAFPSVWPRMTIQDGERRVLFEPGDVDRVVSAITDIPAKGDCWWYHAEMAWRFVETERSRRRRVGIYKRVYAVPPVASAPVRPMPMAEMHRPGPRFLTSGFVLFGTWAQQSKQRPRRGRLSANFIQEIVECPSQRP